MYIRDTWLVKIFYPDIEFVHLFTRKLKAFEVKMVLGTRYISTRWTVSPNTIFCIYFISGNTWMNLH